ncbi:MAG: class II aldolase/adducin family protein, partial [Candidatus Nanoarchaeia archaeon]|nr:class II aldolase/adducin family protein [Candidatus Nanoarchaeia archaeon]
MNTLVNQILDALRHESIAPSRVAIAWRQEEGQYGYVLGEGEPEMLSFCKLKAQNLLFAGIFAARPDIHVVIRSSPSYVEAASSIRNLRSFRPPIDDAAQIIGTRIVLAKEDRSGRIIRALKKGNACIVKDDAYALSVGASPERAIAATLVLEKSCLALVEGTLLGGMKPVNPLIARLYSFVYKKFYGNHDEEVISQTKEDLGRDISEEEMEKREAVIRTGQTLIEENLVQGTWGNVSIRLDDRSMLVTPSGLSYHRLSPYDIVR